MQKKMNLSENATELVDLSETEQDLLIGGAGSEDLQALQRLQEEFAAELVTSSTMALPSFLRQLSSSPYEGCDPGTCC